MMFRSCSSPLRRSLIDPGRQAIKRRLDAGAILVAGRQFLIQAGQQFLGIAGAGDRGIEPEPIGRE